MTNEKEKRIFAKNLQKYMDIADVDRNQLSKDTGIKYPTICEWLNLRKYPRIDKIEMLANYFGVQKSDLIEDHDEAVSKTVQIPVLGSVPAGTPVEAVQDIISYEEIPEKWQRNGEYFALKISGSSMFPAICDGDIAIVKKTDEVKNGDTVIAMVNGYEATCKRYKKMGDSMMLLPNNQDYDPMFYSKQDIKNLPVKILGKVVELRRKFK